MVYESNEINLIKLQDGAQGTPGKPGEPGETLYTWVKYSQYADGTDLTDDPTDAVYIGIAYNKEEQIESNNKTDYTWSKIKGDKGEQGIPGTSGKDAAIQSTTAPTDTTYMWLDISVEPPILKRYDGTKWVIVNDMSKNIQFLEQNFSSSIKQSESNIKSIMTKNYYLKGDTDKLVNSVQTSWEQTARGFEAQFTTLNKDIGDVANEADARFQEISSYIRFDKDGIILGKSDSPLILKQENDHISFIQNNSEVASFSDDKLYVTYGEFFNSIKIGNFAFIPRTNGNLSFKKIT